VEITDKDRFFVPVDKATKKDCLRMIDYFSNITGCTEMVIKLTNRLYEIVDFECVVMGAKCR